MDKDYEDKFQMFKKLIDETFSSYKKKYFFSYKSYKVKFVLTERDITFEILPYSKWYELKKQIEDKLSNLSSDGDYCKICFEGGNKLYIYCDCCTFVTCSNCYYKIFINNFTYSCPQCRHNPFKEEDQCDFGQNQYMKILGLCL